MPSSVDQKFFEYLKDLTPKDVTIYAMEEGSVVFPRLVKNFLKVACIMQIIFGYVNHHHHYHRLGNFFLLL